MEVIRASEVADYVYCARSWWLGRVAGAEPEGRERRAHGTLMHAIHGRGVRLSRVALVAGLIALAIALITLVAGGAV
ncbi:MAG: hypothetical protein OHK0015_27750 [Chloroflexi bacterium OHK40]